MNTELMTWLPGLGIADRPVLGILLAIAAGLGWGTAAILARLGLQHIKPAAGTLISLVSSVVLVSSAALVTRFDAVVSLSPSAILWFALVGVINFVAGRQFNFLAIKHIGATKATAAFACAPLFATVIAVVFIGESVTPITVVGTFSIVAGLYLVMTSL